jgi:hypothetical protein
MGGSVLVVRSDLDVGSSVGPDAVGPATVGPATVGPDAVGPDAVGVAASERPDLVSPGEMLDRRPNQNTPTRETARTAMTAVETETELLAVALFVGSC